MNNTLKIAGIFQVLTGTGILGIWIINMLGGAIPELQTELIRIAMHLLAEFFTGTLLLVSGIYVLLKKKKSSALFYLSFGALFYTLIASPGYFVQKEQLGVSALFLVLLVLSIAVFLSQLNENKNTKL